MLIALYIFLGYIITVIIGCAMCFAWHYFTCGEGGFTIEDMNDQYGKIPPLFCMFMPAFNIIAIMMVIYFGLSDIIEKWYKKTPIEDFCKNHYFGRKPTREEQLKKEFGEESVQYMKANGKL